MGINLKRLGYFSVTIWSKGGGSAGFFFFPACSQILIADLKRNGSLGDINVYGITFPDQTYCTATCRLG